MKTFQNMAAQGDMLIRRIDKLPEDLELKDVPTEGGKHILTHSESGHHHVVLERPGVRHLSGMDVLRSFLVVPEDTEVDLLHERDTDTHETLRFGPGVYEIRRQREADVGQGWRIAAD